MRGRATSTRLLTWRNLAIVATVALVGLTAMLHLLGDRWWPVVVLLYGPRWMLFPLVVLTMPFMMVSFRRGIVLFAVAALVFVFGLLGYRPGFGRSGVSGADGLRVVEFNMGAAGANPGAVTRWLDSERASLVMLVECNAAVAEAIGRELAMRVKTAGSICVLSAFPIDEWESRDQREFWERRGSGAVVRGTLRLRSGPMRFGVVHLATPRDALSMMRDLSTIPTLGPLVNENRQLRSDESRAARAWIGGPSDVAVIGGDFNLPVESAVYRSHWGDYQNAFSRAGRGLGHTKRTRWFGVRIDHILAGRSVEVRRSQVGPDLGSDHRPVVADVVVR